jgi:hypothetical protein
LPDSRGEITAWHRGVARWTQSLFEDAARGPKLLDSINRPFKRLRFGRQDRAIWDAAVRRLVSGYRYLAEQTTTQPYLQTLATARLFKIEHTLASPFSVLEDVLWNPKTFEAAPLIGANWRCIQDAFENLEVGVSIAGIDPEQFWGRIDAVVPDWVDLVCSRKDEIAFLLLSDGTKGWGLSPAYSWLAVNLVVYGKLTGVFDQLPMNLLRGIRRSVLRNSTGPTPNYSQVICNSLYAVTLRMATRFDGTVQFLGK